VSEIETRNRLVAASSRSPSLAFSCSPERRLHDLAGSACGVFFLPGGAPVASESSLQEPDVGQCSSAGPFEPTS